MKRRQSAPAFSMLASPMLAALCALTVGCGTANDSLTKEEARALVEAEEASEDICTSNGFDEDGECDEWCPDGDAPDCPVSNACTDGDTRDADDGCNTCTCQDGTWACTEIACNDQDPGDDDDGAGDDGEARFVVGDCAALPDDPVDLKDASLKGDVLSVEVGYGAGCAEHTFSLCWDGTFLESNPVQVHLGLHHDANGEMCEAYATETLHFDLTELREGYTSGYQTDTGRIFIHLEQTESFDYSF